LFNCAPKVFKPALFSNGFRFLNLDKPFARLQKV
jgi:hypothetical protein